MTDARVAKWTRWIQGSIEADVVGMHDDRQTWRCVSEMLEANDGLPTSYWWEFMRDTYGTTQAVAVRRQAVPDPASANLGTMLLQLSDDCQRVTRDDWVEKWGVEKHFRQLGREKWDEHFGGAVGEHLDPAIVLADSQRLGASSAGVKRYVDRHLAHSDAKAKPSDAVNLTEVHEAIDVIGHIFSRYYSLFTASSFLHLTPTVPYDWMAVFRTAWMPDGWRG